jgi:hypothetical protein
MIEKQPTSRPINLHLRPKPSMAPAVFDRLDRIQGEVENQETRRRARDITAAHGFRNSLRAICLDLNAAFQLDPTMEIGVRRDNTALCNNPAYPKFVTARSFVDALDGLIATQHVEQISTGNEASGRSTRVRGTEKLCACLQIGGNAAPELQDHSDLIRLKVGKKGAKRRQIFAEDEQTEKWRHNLECINQLIASYKIGIDLTEADKERMEANRRKSAVSEATIESKQFEYERVNFFATRLYRSFSNPNWQHGGRFYGGFWISIPKQYRPFITINGKATCEYDFSALHLTLLYARVGKPVPNHLAPYSMPFGAQWKGVVKAAINIMLNVNASPSQRLVPDFSEEQMGMSWHSFLRGIRDHHNAIKQFFNTKVGTELQRTDSDIAEAVLLQFVKMQQPCLPVHDSFITYTTLADEVADITDKATLQVVGVKIRVNCKHNTEQIGGNGLINEDISDLLTKFSKSDCFY